jgi:hypothetical protein
MNKLYRLSITSGTEYENYMVSDCILGKDFFLESFYDYNEVIEYLDTNFTLMGKGKNYNYYIRKD